MPPIFACRVTHRMVTSARLSHFFNIIVSKKTIQRVSEYGCMSMIECFITRINNTVLFLFHSLFRFANVCLLLPFELFYASCDLLCGPCPLSFSLLPTIVSFLNVCSTRERRKYWNLLSIHAFSALTKKPGKRFYFHFCLHQQYSLPFFEFCLNFLFPH